MKLGVFFRARVVELNPIRLVLGRGHSSGCLDVKVQEWREPVTEQREGKRLHGAKRRKMLDGFRSG